MIAREEREQFNVRVLKYKQHVDHAASTVKLNALVRGLVTKVGGVSRLSEEDCVTFLKDERVAKLVDNVGNTNDPAYVYAFAQKLYSGN